MKTTSLDKDTAPQPKRNRWKAPVIATIVGAITVAIAVTATSGPGSRIRDPSETGPDRPLEPLYGFDHWVLVHQIGTLIATLAIVATVISLWRRRPGHPVALMILATTTLIWLDPVTNWAPYGVYNPDLFHFPETWPWVSIAPTVQPFIVVGYAAFYMLPFLVASAILRRLQRRSGPQSFVTRHPLVSLGLLIFPIGLLMDAGLEMSLVRTQLYIYSQAPEFGTYAAGEWYQFPILWVSVLVNVVMIPVGILLYRDDTGQTQAEKLGQRLRWFPNRPALATFLVMCLVVNLGYVAYAGAFGLIRATKLATSVACPYPFEDTKVYDPNGRYELSGQPGPYFPGIWASWPSGQPDGRPEVEFAADSDDCAS